MKFEDLEHAFQTLGDFMRVQFSGGEPTEEEFSSADEARMASIGVSRELESLYLTGLSDFARIAEEDDLDAGQAWRTAALTGLYLGVAAERHARERESS